MSVSIAFAFLLITATNLVYAQPDQIHSYITNSVNIQNMQVKKVHAGDIDIAYKYDTSPQITR